MTCHMDLKDYRLLTKNNHNRLREYHKLGRETESVLERRGCGKELVGKPVRNKLGS